MAERTSVESRRDNIGVKLNFPTFDRDANCLWILKQWLKKQPHLPQNIPDKDLLKFLRCSQYSIEKAKPVIDAYYTIRSTTEFFLNRGPKSPKFKETIEYVNFFKCAGATTNGEKILFWKFSNPDPALFDYVEATRYSFALMDLYLEEETDQQLDYVIVFDVQGATLTHLAKASAHLNLIRKELEYSQEALPFNLRGVYVINAGSVLETVFNFLKPMVRPEVLPGLHFYKPDDISKLYSVVPKKLLPKEYGGDAPSCKEQTVESYQKVLKGGEILKQKEQFKVNEKLRVSPSRHGDMGLQGSFKKLDFD